MKYGRDELEWAELQRAGMHFLEERARLQRLTSYTETATVLGRRTGLRGFDFSEHADRAAMGYLLGRISKQSVADLGFLISALVTYLDSNDAGPGFFALAQQLRMLPAQPSADQRQDFWVGQVNAAFAHFGSSD